MSTPSQPFSCHFSPNLPELFAELNISLAISTYQAGKVLMVGSDGDRLILLPRTFDTPMGMALKDNKLAIACKDSITVLANNKAMAAWYPNKPNTYDSLFMPRANYFTGPMAMHDLAWTDNGLIGVNTAFSCLCTIDDNYSFTPFWQPHFIKSLAGGDKCHLNGLALENGQAKYVSALGTTDSPGAWRKNKLKGGVIMDVASNEIIVEGLAMPHSPRLYDGELYALLSASGELIKIDYSKGDYEVIREIGGFVRGMSKIGDYLFVGLSKLRKTHTFGDLALAQKELFAGIEVIHLPTGALVGQMQFIQTCEEIYDVMVLPDMKRPGILGLSSPNHQLGISLPKTSFWAKPG